MKQRIGKTEKMLEQIQKSLKEMAENQIRPYWPEKPHARRRTEAFRR